VLEEPRANFLSEGVNHGHAEIFVGLLIEKIHKFLSMDVAETSHEHNVELRLLIWIFRRYPRIDLDFD
jgi:hypothetical protein